MTTIMQHIDMWRMAVDVALVTSILMMAFRYMKGSNAQALVPRTLELESSLRSLITEADAAGRHLNDQLLRREQTLQRLLSEIEGAEQRMSRAMSTAEECAASLLTDSDKAKTVIDELSHTMTELKAELRRDAASQPTPRSRTETPARAATVREPAPVEFQDMAPAARSNSSQPARQFAPQAASLDRQMSTFPAMGLLGDAMHPRRQSGENQAATAPRPAAPREAEPLGQAEMRVVYATAENLLKEGKRVEQVSAQTRIPVEELRMLSQMIEIEREEEAQQSVRPRVTVQTDPRLGALGAVRRTSQPG